MPFTTYQQFVRRTFKDMPSGIETRLHAAVGIVGEAGLLADALRKTWVHNKPLNDLFVKESLGDVLFYLQALANVYNLTILDLMQSNMKKINKRQPKSLPLDATANAASRALGD